MKVELDDGTVIETDHIDPASLIKDWQGVKDERGQEIAYGSGNAQWLKDNFPQLFADLVREAYKKDPS